MRYFGSYKDVSKRNIFIASYIMNHYNGKMGTGFAGMVSK
jgi:hypothetical protein